MGRCPDAAELANKTTSELAIAPCPEHAVSQPLQPIVTAFETADCTAGIGSMIRTANAEASRVRPPNASE
ncbi:hypothetical protein B7435_27380 [Mycolicibacterium peregrinum]|nr:hypothetical protein AWC21_27905 [Mycolicibacterium peregrinum]OWL96969.1 hypothetical protein B7435_27380 [Mycolicibacterium peregrinum]